MIVDRGWRLAAGVAAAAVALAGCSNGSAASGGGPAVSSVPSAAPTGPQVGTSLPSGPSGLPSDPGAADPVMTLSAGASVPPDIAAGDLDTVVFAAGVMQYLHCAGSGSPTVVVATGLGVSHAAWDGPVLELAQRTRTCVYDRPGLGSSPARSSPLQVVDAGLNARELAMLLTTAHQQEPYVLVGQGYGTLVARAFARLYPGRVHTLVLAGSAPPRAASEVFWIEAGHRVDIAASTRAAGRAPTVSAAMKVLVLDIDDPGAIAAKLAGPKLTS
jgi:pimeloyl-ACP methyl ester carboxylesterase